MKRTKIVFLFAIALMLSAGVVVGRLSVLVPKAIETSVAPATMPSSDRHAPWMNQLSLSAEQQMEMDAIWSGMKPKIEKTFDARRTAEKERDDAIQKLMAGSELHVAYDKILDDYHATRSDLDKQREQLIKDAEEKSRALLDEDQKKKWDVLSKQMHDNRGHHSASQRSTTRRDDDPAPT